MATDEAYTLSPSALHGGPCRAFDCNIATTGGAGCLRQAPQIPGELFLVEKLLLLSFAWAMANFPLLVP